MQYAFWWFAFTKNLVIIVVCVCNYSKLLIRVEYGEIQLEFKETKDSCNRFFLMNSVDNKQHYCNQLKRAYSLTKH